MADHDDLISQFTGVTGADTNRAKFYLELANWDVQVALTSFYENAHEDEIEEDLPVGEPENAGSAQSSQDEARPFSRPQAQSRFATLHTLAKEDSGSDSEEKQAFYAGGSERSGQQVLGPGKKKNDIVEEMFKSAKEHGAEVVGAVKGPSTSGAFQGTGYKLGQTSSDTEVVRSPSSSRNESPREVTLKLWKNGFSINSEQLREYSDPSNKDFLQSIRQGEVPQELIKQAQGNEVHLNMEDHRHADYVATRQSVKAFSGKGLVLGCPAPVVIGGTSPMDENDRVANEQAAQTGIELNSELPTTNVQIRLVDGTRLVGRFNHSHTVADLRRYVTIARPQYASVTFTLMTTFPNKELTEDHQTLKEANLLNAAVQQKLT